MRNKGLRLWLSHQLLPSAQDVGWGTHLKGHTAIQEALLDQLLLDGMEPLRAFREAGLTEIQIQI